MNRMHQNIAFRRNQYGKNWYTQISNAANDENNE